MVNYTSVAQSGHSSELSTPNLARMGPVQPLTDISARKALGRRNPEGASLSAITAVLGHQAYPAEFKREQDAWKKHEVWNADCLTYFERKLPLGWCGKLSHRDHAQNRVEAALYSLRPETSLLPAGRLRPNGSHMTFAVLLRGDAYRTPKLPRFSVAPDGFVEDQQIECGLSLHRHIVQPLERLGQSVGFFLTVYDSVSKKQLRQLYEPYKSRALMVTHLRTNYDNPNGGQIPAAAIAVNAFLTLSDAHRWGYDAVLVTRFDVWRIRIRTRMAEPIPSHPRVCTRLL